MPSNAQTAAKGGSAKKKATSPKKRKTNAATSENNDKDKAKNDRVDRLHRRRQNVEDDLRPRKRKTASRDERPNPDSPPSGTSPPPAKKKAATNQLQERRRRRGKMKRRRGRRRRRRKRKKEGEEEEEEEKTDNSESSEVQPPPLLKTPTKIATDSKPFEFIGERSGNKSTSKMNPQEVFAKLENYTTKQHCRTNNTMWQFLIPAYVDSESSLVFSIPDVNWSDWNIKTNMEIVYNIFNNPKGREECKHENEAGDHMIMVLVDTRKVNKSVWTCYFTFVPSSC